MARGEGLAMERTNQRAFGEEGEKGAVESQDLERVTKRRRFITK